MLTYGIETLIQPQLNDPVVEELEDFFVKLKKVSEQYYVKKTINKSDFNLIYKDIKQKFNDITYERFNINIELKPYNTFAILPIFNQDLKTTKALNIVKDVKKAMKQIKEFSTYIQDNEVIIDIKRAKLYNLKSSWSFTYFFDPVTLTTLTPRDFVAITLHEIGHIFTLLEMYTTTTKQIVSLSRSFLSIDPYKELKNKLAISEKAKNDEDVSLLLYDKLNGSIEKIFLSNNREDVETDAEYEADDFVAKFGLSGDLTIALVKLTNVEDLTLSRLPSILVTITILDNLLLVIMALILFNLPTAILLVTVTSLIRVIVFLNNLISSTSKRNPTGDEHGDILTRIKNLKLDIITILRTTDLDVKEKKQLLKQIDSIESKTEIINKSIYNSIIGSMVSEMLLPNLNIRDELSDNLRALIDNELYVKQARFGVGIENRIADIKPNVYINKFGIYSDWLDTIFKNSSKESFKTLNSILEKYGMYLEYLEDFNMLLRSMNDVDVSNGISTIAIVPKEESKSLITLTLDTLKIKYLLTNPYIEVFDIQKVQLTENKYIYVVEVERLTNIKKTDEESNAIANNIVMDIFSYLESYASDYGVPNIRKEIEVILNSDIKNLDIIKPQLELIYEILKDIDPDTRAILDLHNNNFMYNKDNKLVISDPIYYPTILANRISNDMDISNFN